MRRLALIYGMLLTLTAGVWSSALAVTSASCLHEEGAPAASDEHDCCRADISGSNAEQPASCNALQQTSADASHDTSTASDQADDAHDGMSCAASSPATETRPAAVSGLLSCAECCAGGSGQTPATVAFVTPEQNKVKRAAGSDAAGASDLFPPSPAHVSHLAPTQHAPPSPPERRHILISIFLI
ncbi:MAG TPA: hypothetical protein VF527_01830 [Pyrinomonadaceae bacterium]|jgi:hypothetical protein